MSYLNSKVIYLQNKYDPVTCYLLILRLVCVKVKSCYNPLRLGTVIVLVSSGKDFVNTPLLYSDRATR